MDLNYDPRCSSYPKGGYYFISYYLPNGRRIGRSTGSQKKSVARKKMHLKEQELYEGIYDDHDIARMPEYQFGAQIRLDWKLLLKNKLRLVPSTKNLEVRYTLSMH